MRFYVADIHSHYLSQGYRTIADTLLNIYGLSTSDVSLWKSMKRLGITRKEHNSYANVLNREFNAERPMEKIVTDVTYIQSMSRVGTPRDNAIKKT